MGCQIRKLVFEYLETIAFVPGYSAFDTVDSSVVLGALDDFWIFFDRVDPLPSFRTSKCNNVASHSGETVDEDRPVWWSSFRKVACDFSDPISDELLGFVANFTSRRALALLQTKRRLSSRYHDHKERRC